MLLLLLVVTALPPRPRPRPQVSRRLARRLYRELRAGRLGYVRLTAHAYGVLLEAAGRAKAGLYANELLVQSVVRLPA